MPGSLDQSLLEVLYAGHLSASWVDVILGITFLGSGWMMLGLLPALFVRAWRPPAAAVVLMLTLVSILVASLKAVAGRVRPCHALTWAHGLPVTLPTDCSFPSGHAAGSFAFATFVMTLNRRAGWALLPIAAMIGVSRVALGVHYPSDVLAGAVLGSAVGWASARWFNLARRRQVARASASYRLASGISPTQMPKPSGIDLLPP